MKYSALLLLLCSLRLLAADIDLSKYYTTSKLIDGVQYPRTSQLTTKVNIDNNSLNESILTLIGIKDSNLKSPLLRYMELYLKGEKYRFARDLESEIKLLDLNKKLDEVKDTLDAKSNIEAIALKLLNDSIDLSDDQFIKANFIKDEAKLSTYLIFKSREKFSVDKYNFLVTFDSLKNSIDSDFFNYLSTNKIEENGVLKFFIQSSEKIQEITFLENNKLYVLKKIAQGTISIADDKTIINYLCVKACTLNLKKTIDNKKVIPEIFRDLISKNKLNTFKKVNEFKDLNNTELLDMLVKNETSKVIKVLDTPSKENLANLEFNFPEMTLNPREAIYFQIPEKYSKLNVSGITIGHWQDEPASTRDSNPGLTAVAIYTKDLPHAMAWRYWGGHASGRQGAKFAEQRRGPEIDTLYEWPRIGHRSVEDDSKSDVLIKANVIRVRNVGTDSILISHLSLKVIYNNNLTYQDYIFSTGSDFGDPDTFAGRFYNGGQIKRGTFPNALVLRSGGSYPGTKSFPAGWLYNGHSVVIPMNDLTLATIEVMAGDTHPDGVRNKDGGWGSLGSAKISVGIADNSSPDYDTEVEWLKKNENIGPQGVIPASVESLKKLTNKYLIIKNSRGSSPLYIMGIRIGVSND